MISKKTETIFLGTNTVDQISIRIKQTEELINKLDEFLKQSEEEEKELFNQLIRSENSEDYLIALIKKDSIHYLMSKIIEYRQLEINALDKHKYYLNNALIANKKRKREENNESLPTPSTSDLYMS